MAKIEIKEAYNGWIIESHGETRSEPRVFEYDGGNRYRTTLENRIETSARALSHALSAMIGSNHYRVIIMEVDDAKPGVPSSDHLPGEALPGGLSPSGTVHAGEVQTGVGLP